jgi:hypothetical protein
MLAAQYLLENNQPIKPETNSIAINTISIQTVSIGINTIANSQAAVSPVLKQKQLVVNKPQQLTSLSTLGSTNSVNNLHGTASSNNNNNNDYDDGSLVKIGLPYPSNLRAEKMSENSLLVRWDPPTTPISLNQSIDIENLNASTFDEQIISIQNYNLFLNHDLHSVLYGGDECAAIVEDIDLNTVNCKF